jgi:hypothetical protein
MRGRQTALHDGTEARRMWPGQRLSPVISKFLGSCVDLADRRSTHGQKSKARPKEHAMRFLGYTLADPSIPIPPPSPDMFAKMGAFIEEATKAGVLVATGGLGPVDEAVRVKYDGTNFTVLDGPFSEAKELVGGWAVMETRDKDEAIEWTKRFLAIAGPGESTIRPVY